MSWPGHDRPRSTTLRRGIAEAWVSRGCKVRRPIGRALPNFCKFHHPHSGARWAYQLELSKSAKSLQHRGNAEDIYSSVDKLSILNRVSANKLLTVAGIMLSRFSP